jgi:hypothetical protein
MNLSAPDEGLGLFVGWQDRTNAIAKEPPRSYLTRLDNKVTGRAWYAGHQGVMAWGGRDLYLNFFVDPSSSLMFAQPCANEEQARRREWFEQGIVTWTFEDARNLSRWLALYTAYVTQKTTRKKLVPRLPEFWTAYLDGRRPEVAPLALGLPREPDKAFAGAGWVSWEDWSWEPVKKRDKKPKAAKDKKQARKKVKKLKA